MNARIRHLALLLVVALGLPLVGGGAASASAQEPVPAVVSEPVPAPPGGGTVTAVVSGFPAQVGAASVGAASVEGSSGVVSAPVEAPIPFAMVGLELPEGAAVRVRTSVDGRAWGGWLAAERLVVDDGPDVGSPEGAGAAERFTEPLWVGEARWIQVEVAGAAPAAVSATFLDPVGLGAGATVGAAAVPEELSVSAAGVPSATGAPARGMPAITTRAQWGANEAATRTAGSATVRFAVIHHTAGGNAYTRAEAPAVVRGIHAYHTGTLRWSDIGYNFLVDRYGRIYEGRRGSIERGTIGAHAQGFNTGSVGVSVLGDFSSVAPPPAALAAVADVLAWKFAANRVDPTGRAELTSLGSNKYSRGTTVSMSTIIGHRDVGQTACPGVPFQALLPQLRTMVHARMATFPIAPSAPGAPPSTTGPGGYWMLGTDGEVHAFGPAPDCGELFFLRGTPGGVDIEPFPDGRGYWILDERRTVTAVSCDGTVQAAGFAGGRSFADQLATGERPVSMSVLPDGTGYWVFTDRGRVLTGGSARSFGDMAGIPLNGPVLDSVATPSGQGYWMVASDGGIFAFGDARFVGSMGGRPLNRPVLSMAPDPDGRGYWLVAADGGIFAFEAPFYGSMGASPLNRPITGMVASPTGGGYLMVAEDGGAFTYGDVAFHGSLGDRPPASPVTAIAARR